MLTASGPATTPCCRELEIDAAFKLLDELDSGDHRSSGRNDYFQRLAKKENQRLDMMSMLMAGGQGPRLLSTPPPLLFAD